MRHELLRMPLEEFKRLICSGVTKNTNLQSSMQQQQFVQFVEMEPGRCAIFLTPLLPRVSVNL
jgi:hypothetical protein